MISRSFAIVVDPKRFDSCKNSANGFLRMFMYFNLKFQGYPEEFKTIVKKMSPHILGNEI